MRWHSITWKPTATGDNRIACMAYLLSLEDPPMPSEFFISDRWENEMPRSANAEDKPHE